MRNKIILLCAIALLFGCEKDSDTPQPKSIPANIYGTYDCQFNRVSPPQNGTGIFTVSANNSTSVKFTGGSGNVIWHVDGSALRMEPYDITNSQGRVTTTGAGTFSYPMINYTIYSSFAGVGVYYSSSYTNRIYNYICTHQ